MVVLSSCLNQSNKYSLSEKQEIDLLKTASILRKTNFNGSISINKKELRDSCAEIVTLTLPDSVFNLSKNNKIENIVIEPEFIYFVMNSFKGTNYGIVLSSLPQDKLYGFYDVKSIRKCNLGYWYFVSSKLW